MVWYGMDGSGGFLCAWREVRAKGLAHREAERRGGGGEGEILGFGPWSLVLLQDPAARRATLVDRLRDGQDDEQGHAVEKLAEWDDFGAHFGPPLDRIGIPACVF